MCAHPNYSDLLNNLHYFYSTAPQVLGAILAITGAYVVFRVDSLKKEINGATQKLIDCGKTPTRHPGKFDNGLYKAFNRYFENKSDDLRYDQIANRFDKFGKIISEGLDKSMIDLKNPKDHNLKIEKIKLMQTICEAFLDRKENLDRFIKDTKRTYRINGGILALLIVAFFIIPLFGVSTGGYWALLTTGITLTIISLMLILRYLIRSI